MGPSVSYRIFIEDVAGSIRTYCGGDRDMRRLHRLVDLASTTVQTSMPGRLRAAAGTQATSVSNLSTSLVSSLFPVDGQTSPLKRAIDRIGDMSELDLFRLFRKIVVQTASNELFHRWAEYDPYSARLWRNLHRVIRLDNRLVAFPLKHPQWVALRGNNTIRCERMPAAHTDLVLVLTAIDLKQSKLGDIVFEALSRVTGAGEYSGTVAIENLFSALQEVSFQLAASELHHGARQRDEDPISHLALNRALNGARQKTKEKLQQYAHKGNLTGEERGCFEAALDDLLCDCANGGQAQSYFRYLRVYRADLSHDMYFETYRTRFEYLAKFARQQLKEMASNEIT